MKHNYLNNKDILKEIHKSKNTYCWYANEDDHVYDLIITDGRKITKKDITEAKKNRAERLTKQAHEAALAADGIKRKLEEFEVKHTKIPESDLVFRIMTWEHVPIQDPKLAVKKRGGKIVPVVEEEELPETEYDADAEPVAAKPTKYVKVNFPPFQHVKLEKDEEGTQTQVVVGISHWVGSPSNGHFSREHGTMTNKLAHMFMKLCERYATRSNWRGYTYNDEMRSQALLQLSQIGLQFDESKSANPFAYYTAAITNSFTRVLNIEKRNQNLRDDILQMNNLNPSYTRQLANSMHSGGGSDGGSES
jgi:hypothetical protein